MFEGQVDGRVQYQQIKNKWLLMRDLTQSYILVAVSQLQNILFL